MPHKKRQLGSCQHQVAFFNRQDIFIVFFYCSFLQGDDIGTQMEGRPQEEHMGSETLAAAAHQDKEGTDTHTGGAGGEASEVQPKLQKVGELGKLDEGNS